VDILVREPATPSKIPDEFVGDINQAAQLFSRQKEEDKVGGVKFRSSHFGKSDYNVLASIRGYFTDLGKKFFAFEIQSDWGQARSKNEERAKELKKRFTIKKRDDNTYEVMDGQWSYDGRIFATLKQAE